MIIYKDLNLYYYKSSLKELGIKEEDLIKESDKLGITQTDDDRKKKRQNKD